MNVHDSEKMLGILSENGYSLIENVENADLIIFNTCAIREKAEQKFYSQLGRTKSLKKIRRNLKIVVVGCIAQDAKSKIFERAPFVDHILGPQNLNSIGDLLSGKHHSALIDENREIGLQEFNAKRQSKIKAWVSIMYGCNNFCSYCIVPYTRGREVSRPGRSILQEINELYAKGYKEITLLGQNVNSYKSDMDFTGLLREIDAVKINRVRFVTSHPRDLSVDLISAVSELPSVCEHIHLPLQSGSDKILNLMNRGYSYKDYIEKIKMLRNKVPGVAITADIIAGFPGETDKDYMETVKALIEIEFDGVFAFRFSPRKGTTAYEMEGQVEDEIKSERLNNLLKIQEEITYRKNKMLEDTIQEILIEGPSDTDREMLMGRTRTNKIVTIHNSAEKEGTIINAKIQRARRHSLFGIKVGLQIKPAS